MDTKYRTLTIIVAGALAVGVQALGAPADRGRGPRQDGSPWQGRGNRPDARVPARPGGPAWQERGFLPLDRMLERADINDDGALSADELDQLKQRAGQFRGRMQGLQTRGSAQRGRQGGRGQRSGRGPGFQPGSRRGPGPWLGGRPRPGGRGPAEMQGPQGRGPLPLEPMLERADANKDGTLSADELGKLKDRADQFRGRMRGPQARGGAQRGWEGDRGRRFGGGPWMQGSQRRGPGAWSGDGVGAGGEGSEDVRGPQGRRGPLPLDQMFERADTNGDGALSKGEVEAFRGEMRVGPPFRQR